MRRAIVVCGLICSGKSTIVKSLSVEYGWDIISFGNYVRHVGLHQDGIFRRRDLQQLGILLLNSCGAEAFLSDVIQFAEPKSDTHVFDGVRHMLIVNAIRKRYESSLIVFTSASVEQRYGRCISRSRIGDPILSVQEFSLLDSHKIEIGTREIEQEADLSLNTSIPLERLRSELRAKFGSNGEQAM